MYLQSLYQDESSNDACSGLIFISGQRKMMIRVLL